MQDIQRLFQANVVQAPDGLCLVSDRLRGRRTLHPVTLIEMKGSRDVHKFASFCESSRESIRHTAALHFKDFDFTWGFYGGEQGKWVMQLAPTPLPQETLFIHLPLFINWPHFFWETPLFVAAGVFFACPTTHVRALNMILSRMMEYESLCVIRDSYAQGGLTTTTLHMIDPKAPRLPQAWESIPIAVDEIEEAVQVLL